MNGVLVNSGRFDGMRVPEARQAMERFAKEKGFGGPDTQVGYPALRIASDLHGKSCALAGSSMHFATPFFIESTFYRLCHPNRGYERMRHMPSANTYTCL